LIGDMFLIQTYVFLCL